MEKMVEKSGQDTKTRRMKALITPIAEGLAIVAVAAALGGCRSDRRPQEAPAAGRESQVVLAMSDEEGRIVNISVLEFRPGKAVGPASSIRGARLTVQYFNGDAQNPAWLAIPGCEEIVADMVGTGFKPGQGAAPDTLPHYYGQCDLTAVVGGRPVTDIRATFIPRPSENVAPSSAIYEYAPPRARLSVFESDHVGRTGDGQVYGVGVTHISRDGRPFVVGVVLNVVESTPTDWMVYQKVGSSMLLLNPEYQSGSHQRYIGAVMGGAQLTDGSRGDFVVKVYGNMSRPAGLPAGTGEWSPIAESDGRIRPENVIMRLETGKLYPDPSRPLDPVFSSATIRTKDTSIAVPEEGATTFVALYR